MVTSTTIMAAKLVRVPGSQMINPNVVNPQSAEYAESEIVRRAYPPEKMSRIRPSGGAPGASTMSVTPKRASVAFASSARPCWRRYQPTLAKSVPSIA